MPTVALVQCPSYEPGLVKESIAKGIELIGGIANLISPDDKVLLKPNLLAGIEPNRAVTTHPEIFRAVVSVLSDSKIKSHYGDGPGVISFRKASIRTGFRKVAKELNVKEIDFRTSLTRKFPDGRQNRSFEIYKSIGEFNKIISLPKFKTHELTRITCAVKNQYGTLSFGQKRKFHAAIKNREQFARLLLDLNACINPCLYIADAVQAMEGSGPMNGKPVNLGLIAISEDPVALDATLCRIINLDPYLVNTIRLGEELGFGIANNHKIVIVGNPISDFLKNDFKVKRRKNHTPVQGGILNSLFNSLLKIPSISEANCTGCGDCTRACPTSPKALSFSADKKTKVPSLDPKLCISCYCCAETCIHNAISLVRKGLRKTSL